MRYWISVLEISKQKSDTFINALIDFIDQVHHNLRHHILFFCTAFGNHQRQGDQCIVIQKARTVGTVENPIILQKPQEQESGDAFISVAEGVVLDRQIEQISRLFLDARIEIPPAEGW